MKFTDAKIQALKTKPDRYEVWETALGGFGIRISPAGRKSWVYLYRFNGKPRRMTLGTYPAITVSRAHQLYADARLKVELGDDPAKTIMEKKRAHILAPTVTDIANEYIEKWAKPRKKTWREDQRILEKNILPRLGNLKAAVVKRRDIISFTDELAEQTPVLANRALALMSRLFNFAVDRDILESSPCLRIPRPSKEKRRERVLSDDEIRLLWRSLETASMTPRIRLAIKFLLVTGQRRSEVAQAPWDEFDIKSGWWSIPPERTKNGLLHRVPLSDQAIEILTEIKKTPGASASWLFPAKSGKVPIKGDILSKAIIRNRTHFGFADFGLHDLRRTAASHMTSSGIDRLVVSKILNHVERNITATYDRFGYDNEKRMAIDIWNKKLEIIISGKTIENVIPFTKQNHLEAEPAMITRNV